MVSNGMSPRRTTLKRPIVCKSARSGNCGACDFNAVPQVTNPQTNENVEWQLNLNCDPDPTDPEFAVAVQGAFTPNEPPPVVIANTTATWRLVAPPTAGDYIVKFSLLNGDRCTFVYEYPISVSP